jgi:glucokinase
MKKPRRASEVGMYLGIEIGGTKLQIGMGDGDGRLAALWRGQVDPGLGADGIRRQIVSAVPDLLWSAGVERPCLRAAGIGFGGPVDDAAAVVIKSHQIPGWDGFPLAAWIKDAVGLPAVLGNDADVAGLAEALFGAGKGGSPVFYVTLGSGIGGGLIVDGKIQRGCGRGAAEIGHLRVPLPGDPLPGDPLPGVPPWRFRPLEEVASGWALQTRARREAAGADAAIWRQVQGGDAELTAAHVARAAALGHAPALAILDEAWDYLAEGLCHVIALVGPRRIVIGGGVSLMGETLLFAPLRERVARRVFAPFAGCYEIVAAALGEEVVVHGALALARSTIV